MIKVVIGDLLKATEDVIVHQVNCQAKMGSGIALQIKKKCPTAYEDYMKISLPKKGDRNLLGQVVLSKLDNGQYIAHLFGQLNYGYDGKRYTSYDALHEGLEYIKNACKKANKSVAIPYKIGSDRGGADWDVVYKMIEKIFDDYEVTIYKLEEK